MVRTRSGTRRFNAATTIQNLYRNRKTRQRRQQSASDFNFLTNFNTGNENSQHSFNDAPMEETHEDGSSMSMGGPRYRENDQCKRHALPDHRAKEVQVTGYRRRKG